MSGIRSPGGGGGKGRAYPVVGCKEKECLFCACGILKGRGIYYFSIFKSRQNTPQTEEVAAKSKY